MQIWRLLVITVLNGKSLGLSLPSFVSRPSSPTSSQQLALNHLAGLVEYFVKTPLETRQGRSFEDIERSKGLDYAGEEVLHLHALPVRMGEILPELPEDGVAGTLEQNRLPLGMFVNRFVTETLSPS